MEIEIIGTESLSQILAWHPDIVLVSGPPFYLDKLSSKMQKFAETNAIKLAKRVNTLIIDHHLLRSEEGYKWFKTIASKTKNKVICASDFMGRKRLILEAWRKKLYKKMPVPRRWHKTYEKGKISTKHYHGKLDTSLNRYN